MKTLRFAISLALIAGLSVIHAKAQTAEETLAKIEKDFAAMQISKNPKAIEAVAAVMSNDFYSFDPTNGVSLAKMVGVIAAAVIGEQGADGDAVASKEVNRIPEVLMLALSAALFLFAATAQRG